MTNKKKKKTKKPARVVKKGKLTRQKKVVAKSVGRLAYTLNPDFEFFNELRGLILKSSPAEKHKIVKQVNQLGRVKLAVLSGIFLNKETSDPLGTDLLIVADDINRRRLRSMLKSLEADAGKEIRFAVMDKEEFQYRLAMFDRFVRTLLESPHEKLINKLGI